MFKRRNYSDTQELILFHLSKLNEIKDSVVSKYFPRLFEEIKIPQRKVRYNALIETISNPTARAIVEFLTRNPYPIIEEKILSSQKGKNKDEVKKLLNFLIDAKILYQISEKDLAKQKIKCPKGRYIGLGAFSFVSKEMEVAISDGILKREILMKIEHKYKSALEWIVKKARSIKIKDETMISGWGAEDKYNDSLSTALALESLVECKNLFLSVVFMAH